MLLKIFLLITGIATLYSIKDWRRGVYLMILIGIIKDPIRKMIPSTPAYLSLVTVPIWGGIILGAFIENPRLWQEFRNFYKRLSTVIVIFIASLIPAAVKSATYGTGSWEVALVGFFSYSSVIFGLLIGYIYPKHSEDVKNIIIFYCVVTAIMLIGTPLEYHNVAKGWDALGTAALKGKWVRYGGYGYAINLVSGFYRSPDVMGWHSIMLSMLSIMIALQSSGQQRYVWIAMAGWGLMGGILCGRRKMIFMLPAFISVLCWLYWILPKRIKLLTFVVVVLISSGSGFLIYKKMGPSKAIEKYYFQNPRVVFRRVEQHGFNALIITYRQSGFLGEGLGTATQGIHHLKVSKPKTWQEGGLGRILVELGVPGFLCFLFLSLALAVNMWQLIYYSTDPTSSEFVFRAGLIALVVANAISFIVSHQVFGDPSINCFLSLLIGFILSKKPVRNLVRKPIIKSELEDDSVISDLVSPRTTKTGSGYPQFYKTRHRKTNNP